MQVSSGVHYLCSSISLPIDTHLLDIQDYLFQIVSQAHHQSSYDIAAKVKSAKNASSVHGQNPITLREKSPKTFRLKEYFSNYTSSLYESIVTTTTLL